MAIYQSFEKGWVQRESRHLYGPGENVDAVNVTPDGQGAIITRLGASLLNTVDQSDVHSLHTCYDVTGALVRYQGAGTALYRNFAPILTGLSGTPFTAVTARNFGDEKVYTFFAGGQEALRVKDDGTTLSRWGIRPPSNAPIANLAGTGALNGTYAWKRTYIRKPEMPPQWGRWTNTTSSFTLTSTYPFFLTTVNANDGFVVASTRQFQEVVATLDIAATVGTVYQWFYWDGQAWVLFRPLPLPNFGAVGTTYARWDFPLSSWVPYLATGLYVIRVGAPIAPAQSARVTRFRLYDSVISVESNPSAPSAPVVVSTTPVGYDLTLSQVANPADIDHDLQITHNGLYRTVGNDPAWVTGGGTATLYANYFFEQDAPIEVTLVHSSLHDAQLGELILLDNDRPPAFTTITQHQNRLWGAVGNRVRYSKVDMPESFPGANYFDVSLPGDPVRRLKQYDGQLYIWTTAGVFLVIGNDETSYTPVQIQCPTGLGAFNTVDQGARGVYFLGSDGNLWLLQGTTTAVNVSQDDHYQFFHSLSLHGVLPLNQAARSTCVGVWAYGRYYLSYPDGVATFPSRSLFVDESEGTWWRDSRAWRSMHYDKQGNTLYGGTRTGTILFLETGTTDQGTPIAWTVQTADQDEQSPDRDKLLEQLTVEAHTQGAALTVTAVRDYGTPDATPLGTVTTTTRTAQILPSAPTSPVEARAFGWLLTGTTAMVVYRLLVEVVTQPATRRAWINIPSTLGYAGPKILESFLLDAEVRSGTLTATVYADNVPVETSTLGTAGRALTQLVHAPHEGDVFQIALEGTGDFRIYDSSVLGWRPLPPPIYTDNMIFTDMGSTMVKVGLSYSQDIELLGEGTLTVRFLVDGSEVHHILYDTPGRQRTDRLRLPASMRGRLFEVRRLSTVPYRLWNGTVLETQVVGEARPQEFRFATEPYGQFQRTPLLSLMQAGG